ncbi:MAG: MarR family winged helix-turn-helix transcriptional regulator [Rudaea sp.]
MIAKVQYVALSGFRSRLAQFLRFSERAAHDAGLQPLQYLLLLHLRGFPRRDWATIGELAARLYASHQGTVALVKRCERNGLITKQRNLADGRRVEIHLTAKARALLERVASVHRNELKRLADALSATNAETI